MGDYFPNSSDCFSRWRVWVLPVAVVRVMRRGPPVEVRAEPREVRSRMYLSLPVGGEQHLFAATLHVGEPRGGNTTFNFVNPNR